jgi:hypothetical protein
MAIFLFQDDPCGIGGPSDPSGPCSGSYLPSDAGKGAFDGLTSGDVIPSLLAAGVVVVAVLFAVFMARKVGLFFSGRAEAREAAELMDKEASDRLAKGWNTRKNMEDFGEAIVGARRRQREDEEADMQDDMEDDMEQLDWDGDREAQR